MCGDKEGGGQGPSVDALTTHHTTPHTRVSPNTKNEESDAAIHLRTLSWTGAEEMRIHPKMKPAGASAMSAKDVTWWLVGV